LRRTSRMVVGWSESELKYMSPCSLRKDSGKISDNEGFNPNELRLITYLSETNSKT
jgi:hypothetical protein